MTTTQNIFSLIPHRRDAALTVVQFVSGPKSAAGLLRDVCCNAVTGYVRETTGGAMVPRHAAERVAAELVRAWGWTRA